MKVSLIQLNQPECDEECVGGSISQESQRLYAYMKVQLCKKPKNKKKTWCIMKPFEP